jgi:hypothetical protein|nr:MAG TPA: hypothetical protein [Caudoviricetes sp.]
MADTIQKETFTVSLTYEMSVNIDTGEILETRLIDRSIGKSDLKVVKTPKKKTVQDDGEEPKLILEENKYRLTSAAVSLMGLDEDSKLVIKYEDGKSGSVPVIGTNTAFGISSGNKLTKSNTVACRGGNREELAKHGTEFTLVPHPNKDGLFILHSGEKQIDQLVGDDNVKVEGEEGENIPFDLDLSELVDDQDANITEVDSSFFKL